jgi:hypothetical protein
VKQGQLNFTGNFSIQEHSSLLWIWWWNFPPSLYPSCFLRVNWGILVNKSSKHLFTSLPFLHRNLFGNPFLNLVFPPFSPSFLWVNQIDWLSWQSKIRVFLEKSWSDL